MQPRRAYARARGSSAFPARLSLFQDPASSVSASAAAARPRRYINGSACNLDVFSFALLQDELKGELVRQSLVVGAEALV